MKTKRIKLIALMITLAAVLTGFNAEAQKREYRSNKNDNNKGKRYQTENRQKREYKKSERNYKGWGDVKKSKKYDKKNRDFAYKHNDRHFDYKYYDRHHDYRYHHPKYGTVYRKFHKAPLKLRHARGDYYFYGGHYYRYYSRIGYVRVELPRHLVFDRLPFNCEAYRVGHHTYYRHGDLMFERCDHGYRLAPSIGIQISAHF
ncbi:hypothetical protein ACUNWD_06390 [Sunxiuqinia sp. A32]|uniref:hypothetical protein n=1 Tax=Sunxiuqinia sp. A32 TaxID=3461496 RepID=UPI0040456FF5